MNLYFEYYDVLQSPASALKRSLQKAALICLIRPHSTAGNMNIQYIAITSDVCLNVEAAWIALVFEYYGLELVGCSSQSWRHCTITSILISCVESPSTNVTRCSIRRMPDQLTSNRPEYTSANQKIHVNVPSSL